MVNNTAAWMIIGLTAGGLITAVGALLAQWGQPRTRKSSSSRHRAAKNNSA